MAYTYAKPVDGWVDSQGVYHLFTPNTRRHVNAVSGLGAFTPTSEQTKKVLTWLGIGIVGAVVLTAALGVLGGAFE